MQEEVAVKIQGTSQRQLSANSGHSPTQETPLYLVSLASGDHCEEAQKAALHFMRN